MSDLTPHWRPNPYPRAIVIGLLWRDAALLCAEVTRDDGALKGYRPLGGGIEMGETAAQALAREFREEVQAEVTVGLRRVVLENIFHHEGALGHEIVIVHDITLQDAGLIRNERFLRRENGRVTALDWVPISRFRSGAATLFPNGLLETL